MITISSADAIAIFKAGLQAVMPQHCLPAHIGWEGGQLRLGSYRYTADQFKRIKVLAMGKAAAAMAATTRKQLDGLSANGLIVTKYGHALQAGDWQLIEAGHPVPDANSVKAGAAVLEFVRDLDADDLLIVLTSGGASALVTDIPGPITLTDIQQLSNGLLQCGAGIHAMNTVRKHLSALKGGQLARAAFPATVHNFVLSDVAGDDLSVIASGPCFPDPSTYADAWNVLEEYELSGDLPIAIEERLKMGIAGELPETPKPGDPLFTKVYHHLIGTNEVAQLAAAKAASNLGYNVVLLPWELSGECRHTAIKLLREAGLSRLHDFPCCFIAGGETTVTLQGEGIGGRNQEFALAALDYLLHHRPDRWPVLLSAGTDGTDGPTEAAGGFFDDALVSRVQAMQLDTADYLRRNDSWHFLQIADGLVITGPTQTNVMDLVVLLLDGPLYQDVMQ